MFHELEQKIRAQTPLELALDTCVVCLMSEADHAKRVQWDRLEDHRTAGRLSYVVASRVVQDKAGDPDEQRRLQHLSSVSSRIVPSVFRFDESFFDVDVFDDDQSSIAAELELLWEVQARIPGSRKHLHDLRDIDHIEAAIRERADAFLTTDRKILGKRDIIYERYRMTICTPLELFERFDLCLPT